MKTPPPGSERELHERATALSGQTLAEIAEHFGVAIPTRSVSAKGWAGVLLELALGADAASRPMPDFTTLGIELKTIPVNKAGKPRESTFVCTAPLDQVPAPQWRESVVCRKLSRVLWIPILTEADMAPGERRLGTPLLWSPNEHEHAALEADWDELMDLLALGRSDEISGALGQVLQVRPKAANARARTQVHDSEGNSALSLPRGFYLRAGFTAEILQRALQEQ